MPLHAAALSMKLPDRATFVMLFFAGKYILPDYRFPFSWVRLHDFFCLDRRFRVSLSFLPSFLLSALSHSLFRRTQKGDHSPARGTFLSCERRGRGLWRTRGRRETTAERTAARGTTQATSEGEATLRLPGRRSGKRGRSQTGASHCLAQVAVSLHFARILSPCRSPLHPCLVLRRKERASLPLGQYGGHLERREAATGIKQNSGRRVQQCTQTMMFKHREAEVAFKITFLKIGVVRNTTLLSKYETLQHLAFVSLQWTSCDVSSGVTIICEICKYGPNTRKWFMYSRGNEWELLTLSEACL